MRSMKLVANEAARLLLVERSKIQEMRAAIRFVKMKLEMADVVLSRAVNHSVVVSDKSEKVREKVDELHQKYLYGRS